MKLFGPQDGMKGGPFIVERERVSSALYARTEYAVGELKWPHPIADAAGHFVDWKSICGHRIPDADELYIGHLLARDLSIGLVTAKNIQDRHEDVVAEGTKQHLDPPHRVIPIHKKRSLYFY